MHTRWLGRRLGGALVAALALAVAPAWAQVPRQNLWVELRWVEQSLSGAAAAGVRDGSVVVSTGGSVSPRGGVSVSTERSGQREQSLPRLMVLNGQQASISLNEATPVQWVDVSLERQGDRRDRYYVAPRQGMAERTRGVTVKPMWPGGRQPVTVEVRTQDQTSRPPGGVAPDRPPGEDAQVLSTVQAALGQWVTIARTGSYYAGSAANQYSTRDAEVHRTKELQVRVDLAP